MQKKEEFSAQYSLKRNTVNIFGPIDDAMSEIVIAQLQYLDDNGVDEITVQINSPGGSVSAGHAIRDTMNYVKADISTVCVGIAASMAAILLSSGSKGKRKATPNSEIMIHQPLGGVQGQASDIILAAEHIKSARSKLNKILSENTGRSIEVIEKDTDRDYIMSAQEALEYGLIDVVIPCRNKAKGE